MTVIQQVLFEVEGSYLGHPYFVTGNALFNAIARRVDERTRRALHVSHGVFVPGEFGEYPAEHSQNGYGGKLGQSLPDVEAYEDLFVFRDAVHRWLLDSRPRDAHNTHDIERHGDRMAFAPACVSLGDRRSSEIRSGRCRGSCTATCTGGAMMTSCRSLETCLTGSESAAHATTGSVNCR